MTERARRVLTLANEEAVALNHDYVGTEHLLLGLVRLGEGVGSVVLTNLGLELGGVRAAVERRVASGDRPVAGEVGLTLLATTAVEMAGDEAKRLDHHYIGTEHQLLGLLRVEDGIAAKVLTELGITLEKARTETVRILAQPLPSVEQLKRYNLALPESMYADLQRLADRQHTTVLELVRRFIKLGLLVTQVSETPGAALVIREGEREREIVLL